MFRNFAMGHNLLSLHGLYYSMHGGMWEWAPPCNHHHMPYWEELKTLLECTERLSYLLTRGVHRCDVAVFYPVCAMEADEIRVRQTVETAFEAAKALYGGGVDLDFIDFESLERSEIRDGKLCVAGEQYRMVVLPGMDAIRWKAYEKLVDFAQAGGQVVVMGQLPQASDRAGRNDAQLGQLNQRLAQYGQVIGERETSRLFEILDAMGSRDFRTSQQTPFIQHRVIGQEHLYYVYGVDEGTPCTFRTTKRPWLLDPWKGTIQPLSDWEQGEDSITLQMPLEKEQVQLLLFSDEDYHSVAVPAAPQPQQVLSWEGEWECEIVPTMDNTFGDYRLPAGSDPIGPQVHTLRFLQTDADCSGADLDDSHWEMGRIGCGPQLLVRDPDGAERVYRFSWQTGVPHDAGFQYSYHGLKGYLSDDFLCLGQKRLTHFGSNSVYEGEGSYEVETGCYVEQDCTARWVMGEKHPVEICLDGKPVSPQQTVTLKAGVHRLYLRYENGGRTHLLLRRTDVPEVAANVTDAGAITTRWAKDRGKILFDLQPDQAGKPCWYRFQSPPGMKRLHLVCEGEAQVYADGVPMAYQGDGWYEVAQYRQGSAPMTVAIRLIQRHGQYECGMILEPITFQWGVGRLAAGEWYAVDGLRYYSGGILYRKTFLLSHKEVTVLDLGRVGCACTVQVNGRKAGVLVAPPYRLDVTELIQPGENRVEILVHNTLYNFMSSLPSAYANPAPSGLLGEQPRLKTRLPVVNGVAVEPFPPEMECGK